MEYYVADVSQPIQLQLIFMCLAGGKSMQSEGNATKLLKLKVYGNVGNSVWVTNLTYNISSYSS